jgi:hypothetical protein
MYHVRLWKGWDKIQASTDKKEKKIILMYKEIQSEAVAKSYMRKGFLIYMRKRANISPNMYEEAVPFCNCSILNFLIFEENLIFSFISVLYN